MSVQFIEYPHAVYAESPQFGRKRLHLKTYQALDKECMLEIMEKKCTCDLKESHVMPLCPKERCHLCGELGHWDFFCPQQDFTPPTTLPKVGDKVTYITGVYEQQEAKVNQDVLADLIKEEGIVNARLFINKILLARCTKCPAVHSNINCPDMVCRRCGSLGHHKVICWLSDEELHDSMKHLNNDYLSDDDDNSSLYPSDDDSDDDSDDCGTDENVIINNAPVNSVSAPVSPIGVDAGVIDQKGVNDVDDPLAASLRDDLPRKVVRSNAVGGVNVGSLALRPVKRVHSCPLTGQGIFIQGDV